MQLIPTDVRRVAIVGLAKNTGKTTVLNALLQAGQQEGKRFGVLSVGVDGEQRDVWDLHDKPAIEVWPGVWAATARAAINESSAHLTIVRELKPSSPLGPVYLVRCTQPGRLKLAGTHTLADVRQAMAHFEEYGVDLSIVDGAYDRLAAAGPDVCQGVVLCTGAAVDARVEVAMQWTEEVLAKWQLPQWTDNGSHPLHPRHPGQANEQCLSNKIEEPREVLYLAEGKWRTLGTSSLLAGLTLLRERVAEGGVARRAASVHTRCMGPVERAVRGAVRCRLRRLRLLRPCSCHRPSVTAHAERAQEASRGCSRGVFRPRLYQSGGGPPGRPAPPTPLPARTTSPPTAA
jgi:hypothetical protein